MKSTKIKETFKVFSGTNSKTALNSAYETCTNIITFCES
jgi:hypothetical protein